MVSREGNEVPAAPIDATSSASAASLPGQAAKQPVFWKEVYAFAIVCLLVWSAAAWILPPRLDRHRALRRLESDLETRIADLSSYAERIETAVASIESDAFFREAVYRKFLGVRKKTEEFVDPLPSPHR
jgi:hypothetical protein